MLLEHWIRAVLESALERFAEHSTQLAVGADRSGLQLEADSGSLVPEETM